jgi:hypothetical protein
MSKNNTNKNNYEKVPSNKTVAVYYFIVGLGSLISLLVTYMYAPQFGGEFWPFIRIGISLLVSIITGYILISTLSEFFSMRKTKHERNRYLSHAQNFIVYLSVISFVITFLLIYAFAPQAGGDLWPYIRIGSSLVGSAVIASLVNMIIYFIIDI